MQQFHLLNKTLRSIFTKLTHRACNSPWINRPLFYPPLRRRGRRGGVIDPALPTTVGRDRRIAPEKKMAPWATSVGRDRRIAPQSLHNEIALSGDCGGVIDPALPMGITDGDALRRWRGQTR